MRAPQRWRRLSSRPSPSPSFARARGGDMARKRQQRAVARCERDATLKRAARWQRMLPCCCGTSLLAGDACCQQQRDAARRVAMSPAKAARARASHYPRQLYAMSACCCRHSASRIKDALPRRPATPRCRHATHAAGCSRFSLSLFDAFLHRRHVAFISPPLSAALSAKLHSAYAFDTPCRHMTSLTRSVQETDNEMAS